MTVSEYFDDYIGSIFPTLPRESKQFKALKHAFFCGVRAAGAIQNDALRSVTSPDGFDVKRMLTALQYAQAEVQDFLHPRVVVPETIVRTQ